MLLHNLKQGDNDWHAFRATHFGASEASAVLGISPYKTRTDLLNEKKTGLLPDVNNFTQAIFTKGHEVEKLARVIVEKILNEELSPVTFSMDRLSASCDGLTFMGDVAWETKQFNKAHFDQVKNGELPEMHWPQCQQVLLVTGAEKLFFTISDGTEENTVGMWVYPDADKQQTIVDAWNQFEKDLANYVPVEIIEKPKAQATLALPALFIHAKGEITTSNMKEYGAALAQRLQEVRSIVLITDQDFSNAKEAAKFLRENIQQAKLTKEAMLAQTFTVGEAVRMIDHWCEDMRLTALQIEKDVEREDSLKKQVMVADAQHEWLNRLDALYAETKPIEIAIVRPDFANALKGKRNYASMQDAIDTLMAQKTIEANNIASDIRAKQSWFKEHAADYQFLFADLQNVIYKASEDFQLLVNSRIQAHQETEAKKLEAERARIQSDEEAKAREKIAKEAKEIADAEAAAQALNDHVANAGKVVETLVETVILKTVPAAELREAVVQQQDIIASFFKAHKINNDKYHEYRAVITEFIKHQQVYEIKKAA